MQFGVLTVGDDCTTKEAEGAGFTDPLSTAISTYFTGSKIISKSIPSECNEIVSQLKSWCNSGCDVIFTQGCTRFAIRDITPELPKLVKEETVRLVNAMISEIPQMTMLTRPVCQIIQKTLVVHLRGNAECAIDCFGFIKDTLEPAVALIKDVNNINSKNESVQSKGLIRKSRQSSTIALPSEVQISSPSKVKKSVAYRQEKSCPLLEIGDAQNIVFKEIYLSLEVEVIPYKESLNKVLAEDIYTHEDIPSVSVSDTDGYAIKSSDKQEVRIVRHIVATHDKPCQEELKSGEAFRVIMGAPIPPGADTVVEEEETSFVKKFLDGKSTISINSVVSAGQHIRLFKSAIKANSLVLKKYHMITSKDLGILEDVKKTEVKVVKTPSIGVISTGNEVKYHQKNKIFLMKFLQKYGYNPDDCGIIKDDPDVIKSAFEQAFLNHDVVIISGDAFTTEFDILKEVLIEDFAALIHFEKINMKPGNSTIFATLKYKGHVKIFFGLPGNVNSCNVALIIFIIPTLKFMERCKNYKFPEGRHNVSGLTNYSSKPEYKMLSASLKDGTLQFCLVDQVNCYVNNMVHGNCLALVPKNTMLFGNYNFDIIFFNCF